MADEEKEKLSITIFGWPLRDWVIVGTIMLGGGTGVVSYIGTPAQTREVIKEEIKDLTESIGTIEYNTRQMQRNAFRIDLLEESMEQRSDDLNARMDTLQTTVELGYRNIDRYFRGLIEQNGK